MVAPCGTTIVAQPLPQSVRLLKRDRGRGLQDVGVKLAHATGNVRDGRARDVALGNVSVEVSVGMTLVFLVLCLSTVRWMLKTGYRLKT